MHSVRAPCITPRSANSSLKVDAVPSIQSSGDSETEDDEAGVDVTQIVFSSFAYEVRLKVP